MIPDCQRRIQTAYADLQAVMVSLASLIYFVHFLPSDGMKFQAFTLPVCVCVCVE